MSKSKFKKKNNKMPKDKSRNDTDVLSEKDFYPPTDTRYLRSGVNDFHGGDNFADYAAMYFEYIDELYDD